MVNDSNNQEQHIAILGAGSFGTALAHTSGTLGRNVRWWMRSETTATTINQTHKNPSRLSRYPLSPSIIATNNLAWALDGADLVVLVVPCSAVEEILEKLIPLLKDNQSLLGTMKGIRQDAPLCFSEYIHSKLKNASLNCPLGVLGGPNLAEEIIQKRYTGSIIASKDNSLLPLARRYFQTHAFRLYGTKDMIGVELGGALKNIYGIASGLLDALDEGENCKGLFIADSFIEFSRFAEHYGAKIKTLCDLSGLGDLVATSHSALSRNYRLGMALGKGSSFEEAQESLGGVAEGFNTATLIRAHAKKHHIHMPLLSALEAVLNRGQSVDEFVTLWLSNREKALEI